MPTTEFQTYHYITKNPTIMNPIKQSLMLVALLAFVAMGCNKNKSDLSVKMTDSPGNYARMQVEIENVEVYTESEGWVALESETQSVNVVELNNGATAELANSSDIEAGTYTKARVNFGTDCYVETYDQSGNTHRKELKFDGDGVIEVEMNKEIIASSSNEVILDFDVQESVEEQPGDTFKFEPQMKVLLNFDTGVQGQIDAKNNFLGFIKMDGDDEDYSGYTDANGNFQIRGMAAGTYDIYLYVPQDVAASLGIGLELKVGEVVVAQGEMKSMGSITL
jgi:hypothetical protein